MSASPLVGVDLQIPSETMVLTSMTRSSRSNLPAYPILFPILLVFPDARSSAWKVVSIHRVEYPSTFSYGFYAMAAGETPKVAPSREYLKGGESDSDERHIRRGRPSSRSRRDRSKAPNQGATRFSSFKSWRGWWEWFVHPIKRH